MSTARQKAQREWAWNKAQIMNCTSTILRLSYALDCRADNVVAQTLSLLTVANDKRAKEAGVKICKHEHSL